MMKSRNVKFIILNILSTLIEYFLIFLFFIYIFKLSLKSSLIVCGILFILFLFISIFALIGIQKPSKKVEVKNNIDYSLYKNIVNYASKLYNLDLKVIFEDVPQPNPAFSIGRTIYINTNYFINSDFACGVIAHEVGHAVSGLSRLTPIASLRPSTIFCNLFRLIVIALCNKENSLSLVLGYIFYVLYIIFSLGNLICLYPFMRNDELIANDLACSLGYGKELRTYYSDCLTFDPPKLFLLADNLHPSAKLMIERLNSKLKLKGIEKDLFYCNNHLYNCQITTRTLNLDNITICMSGSIKSEKLVKIKSNTLKDIRPNVIKYLPSLEEINCPNLDKLEVNELINLNNLKKIIVGNDDIYLQIIKCEALKNKPYYNEILNKF